MNHMRIIFLAWSLMTLIFILALALVGSTTRNKAVALTPLSPISQGTKINVTTLSKIQFDHQSLLNAESNLLDILSLVSSSHSSQAPTSDFNSALSLDQFRKVQLLMQNYLHSVRDALAVIHSRPQPVKKNTELEYLQRAHQKSAVFLSAAKVYFHILNSLDVAMLLSELELAQDVSFAEDLLSLILSQAKVSPGLSEGAAKKPIVHLYQTKKPRIADFIEFKDTLYKMLLIAQNQDASAVQIHAELLSNSYAFFQYYNKIKKLADNYPTGDAYRFWYSIKSNILYGSGKIYLPRMHYILQHHLIKIEPELEPGDIAFIKHKWKLTNVAFQGKWSHSILYTGSYNKMLMYFGSDPETNNYFADLCKIEARNNCTDFRTYFDQRFPQISKQLIHSQSKRWPLVTLESKGEGVILSNIIEAMGKDRLAVLRPRLSKKDKALALIAGYSMFGLPYDYDFNGRSRSRLLCTEFINLAYNPDPATGKNGLRWNFAKIWGKPVLEVDNMIRKFKDDLNYGNPNLDFVLYIEGSSSGIQRLPISEL